MSELSIKESVEQLKDKLNEVELLSDNLAKKIELELITIIKKTAEELGNRTLEKPIFKFRVVFDQCVDESQPSISYSIMIDEKEKFTPNKFVGFNSRFKSDIEEKEKIIGKERLRIALEIKKAIYSIMRDDFLVETLCDSLGYNHVTVDLMK